MWVGWSFSGMAGGRLAVARSSHPRSADRSKASFLHHSPAVVVHAPNTWELTSSQHASGPLAPHCRSILQFFGRNLRFLRELVALAIYCITIKFSLL